ncbi:class I adenylate-forming enzyme family protein [Nonomuraea sp. C10]|uniref:class I adenylate-forming enzyme family protein n=1 Tax=Nonomuraea sp. C10 TaxID=2600577 RepID=UPI0011CD6E43|nr:AMP-binding protein [Nonomuraea sp. C10]TXK40151.1 AMP-binding protein [Nonomuraea sp. C10]
MTAQRLRPASLTGRRLSRTQIGEWIDMAAKRSPNRDCFVTPSGTRTFAEVRDRVHRLASGLQAMGLAQGDRVAVLDTDSPEYVETFLALFKLGAVAVPLNFRLSPAEITTLLRSSEASWIFVGDRYAPDVLAARDDLEHLDHVVGFGGSEGTTPFEEVLRRGAGGSPREAVVDDEDIVALAYTSGTTGLPKGVMQSHRMWKTMVSNAVLEYRFLRDEFRYSASPLYHVAGLSLVLNAICRSSASLIVPQWDPAELLRWCREGLTDVFLVPTMISALLRQPDVRPDDFATLRSVFYGAAPMSPGLLTQAMSIMRCDFYNGFGAGTEAGMQTVLTPEDHVRALDGHPHLLGSVGRPGFNIDLQIWDAAGNEVPVGEVGEIVTRSDMVMSGYHGQPEKTAQVVSGGWFKGGDLGYLDEDGYLYLAGRKDDMIIRGGENVYPLEIETTLFAYPGVVECAVVGVPDPHWGETVRAHVVLAEGTEATPEELQRFCRERLAKYKVPDHIRVHTETLPKNASGKVLHRLLREQS